MSITVKHVNIHTTMYTRVYAISLNSKITVLCYLIKHKQNILHLE